MPLPLHHLLLQQNPEWFNVSGAGLPGLSWKKRPLNGCSSSSFANAVSKDLASDENWNVSD